MGIFASTMRGTDLDGILGREAEAKPFSRQYGWRQLLQENMHKTAEMHENPLSEGSLADALASMSVIPMYSDPLDWDASVTSAPSPGPEGHRRGRGEPRSALQLSLPARSPTSWIRLVLAKT